MYFLLNKVYILPNMQEKPKLVVTTRRRKKNQAPPASLDNEDLEHLPPNLPRQLLTLCNWANVGLRNGASIIIKFPTTLFGHPTKAVIFRKDVHAMAHMTEQTGSAIIFYMSWCYEFLKKSQMTDMIGFVDPNDTGAIGYGTLTERSRKLLDRFNSGTNGQIYLVPYNSG
uniref:uncharacterized protein LOC105353350 n=1 Tax=Fragaria vesca subsp. vesca TaxID=101020 RepID=UPI0005C8431A|nr:PREDICTED: uncharacterized protein LOC105353350 [Fragaria vesca subsp. vesca]